MNSIFRNFIIFSLSAGLIIATQVVRHRALAEDVPVGTNLYLDLYNGKRFDVVCGDEGVTTTITRDIKKITTSPLGEMIDSYHDMVNCIFNKNIKRMVKDLLTVQPEKPFTQDDLKRILKEISPPSILLDEQGKPKSGREKCDPKNISTYCTAQAALKEYGDFRAAMIEVRRIERDKAGTQFDTLGGEKKDVDKSQKNIREYDATMNRIDLELDVSRQALDQALAAYNELQTALPLHRKYQEVMISLEQYRKKAADIRKQIELYPDTFLNVTTTECT